MSKQPKVTLPRGTELTPDGIYGSLQNMRAELAAAAITPDQTDAPHGTFRVNLNIPMLTNTWDQANPNTPYYIPFVLPPLQEFMTLDGAVPTFAVNNITPRIILDEVMFSFDQKDEFAAITYRLAGGGATHNDIAGTAIETSGLLNFAGNHNLNVEISLMAKQPLQSYGIVTAAAGNKENFKPTSEIFSYKLDSTFFSGADLNPLVIADLNKNISPYSTYLFCINTNLYGDGREPVDLMNIQISLKFRHPLVPRDNDAVNGPIQNIPVHMGNIVVDNVIPPVAAPLAGTGIEADTADGVNTGMTTIDSAMRERMEGGYLANCNIARFNHLTADAGYEVIAVPMFQQLYAFKATADGVNNLDHQPYQNAAPYTQLVDRRFIPISYPMTIHHVIAAHNFTAGSNTDTFGFQEQLGPGNNTKSNITLEMGTGIASEFTSYQLIASDAASSPLIAANVYSTNWMAGVIDWIQYPLEETLSNANKMGTAGSTQPYRVQYPEWEIRNIPLVGAGGTGYYAQGKPVFVGQSHANEWGGPSGGGNAARTDIVAAGNTSTTYGLEQFLMVSWRIYNDDAATPGLDSVTNAKHLITDLYQGYQGSWIYIIGKKALV